MKIRTFIGSGYTEVPIRGVITNSSGYVGDSGFCLWPKLGFCHAIESILKEIQV